MGNIIMDKIDKAQIEILKTGKDTDESSIYYAISILINKINEIIDELNE